MKVYVVMRDDVEDDSHDTVDEPFVVCQTKEDAIVICRVNNERHIEYFYYYEEVEFVKGG